MMNVSEPSWLPRLQKLLGEVSTPKPGKEGLAKLMASLADVEIILTSNRGEMPAELVHFLERRSYEKAARFCEGGLSIPRGACGTKG